MVLFHEDIKRMKEAERAEKLAKRTPLGRWIRRLFKIGLVFGVLVFTGLTLLSMLGGDHDSLKRGIEDYMTQLTGMKAEIGNFKHMGFYPDLKLDAEKIALGPQSEGGPDVSIGSIDFDAGFFDMLMARRSIKALEIENVRTKPGIVGKERLTVAFLGLRDNSQGDKPGLVLDGTYGERKLSGFMTMDKKAAENGRPAQFVLPEKSDIEFTLGDFHVTGATAHLPDGAVKITFDAFDKTAPLIKGEMIVDRSVTRKTVKGTLGFGSSALEMDIHFTDKKIGGVVSFPHLDLDDIKVVKHLSDILASLPLNKSYGIIDLTGLDAAVKVDVKALENKGNHIGVLSFPLVIKDGVLTANPLSGNLVNGSFAGTVLLDAHEKPVALDIDASLKGISFDSAGGAPVADIFMKASSKAEQYGDLAAGLSGESIWISAKETEMPLAALWSVPLAAKMLPGLDKGSSTTLHCLFASFDIDKGVAATRRLFVDTGNVSVSGSGSIDLVKGSVDMRLDPAVKDSAALKKAVSVHLGGSPWTPDLKAAGARKVSKENAAPVFKLFSADDVGYTDAHPCHELMEQAPENN